ncbi:MAG: TonB family protein [Thermoanaerobaculaceae bacterium]
MTPLGLAARLATAADELAFRDDLTGLFNRRFLNHLFSNWWDDLASEHQRMALLILDLDGFKEVNDTLGHLAGDCVLRRTAEVLRHTFRSDDVLVRFGGDEFVVFLPGAGQAEADRLGQRAREAVARVALDDGPSGCRGSLPVAFSLGVAAFPEDGGSGETLLACADERLYAEKRRRRPRLRASAASLRRGLSLLALGSAVAAGLLAVLLWLLPGSSPTMTVTPTTSGGAGPAPPGPSARELALLEEIERLRNELALREAKTATGPPAGPGEPDPLELRSRIEELEGQLDAERQQQPEPTPAPVPNIPAPVPLIPPEPSPAVTAPPEGAAPAAGPDADLPVVAAPRLLSHETPVYPDRARRFRREAVVELRVTVDASGKVTRVRPVGTPIGLGLEEAARRAAFTARYVPGTRDGEPVETETILTVVFRLDGT